MNQDRDELIEIRAEEKLCALADSNSIPYSGKKIDGFTYQITDAPVAFNEKGGLVFSHERWVLQDDVTAAWIEATEDVEAGLIDAAMDRYDARMDALCAGVSV